MRPDPAVLAELAELDRALAGESSPWSELVADVRAERPRMEPAFAARLDAVVDTARTTPARRPRWLAWSPAAGLAAAIVVAVVLVSGNGSPTTKSSSSVPAPSATATAGAGRAAAPAVSEHAALAPQARKVERNTSLALSTARGKVQDVADNVVATTQRFGGIVDSSQISTSDTDASAVFSLRIPTARLDDAIAALSKLAHVSSLQQGSTDITGAFVSVEARLRDARAERRALLTALAHATTTQAIDAIKLRLRDNRSQIAALKGELNALRRRADLARVDVSIAGNGHASTGGGSWTPGDAARDALRVLEVAAGVLLVALAGGIPLALVLGAAALAARGTRRRRREAALRV
jgi:Domain of unknown function (DUF4349)